MRRNIVLSLLVVVITVGSAIGETKVHMVKADTAIDTGLSSPPLTEPYLAVNPQEAKHIAIGTIVAPVDDQSPWSCSAIVTRDGGDTWMRHDFPIDRCIDPWVLFVEDSLLFTGIEIRRDEEKENRFHLLLFRSDDGGETWSQDPEVIGKTLDHEIFAVDRSREPDAAYFVSRGVRRIEKGLPRHTIYLGRSMDGGRSFEKRNELTVSNLAMNPTGLVLLPDQKLAISYFDYQRNVDEFDSQGMLSRARAWLVRSSDEGKTFSEPSFITDDCASGIEGSFPGYPFLGSDGHRLYHACVRPGFDGIAFSYSEDGGEKWSESKRVDGNHSGAHTRTPMLAVNHKGTIGLAWYDRRRDPNLKCQDVYFTASADGGRTFTEPVRVSTKTSCPETPQNGRAGRSWPMGGDYSSLNVGPNGLFYLVWADSRTGIFRLHHAVIQADTGNFH